MTCISPSLLYTVPAFFTFLLHFMIILYLATVFSWCKQFIVVQLFGVIGSFLLASSQYSHCLRTDGLRLVVYWHIRVTNRILDFLSTTFYSQNYARKVPYSVKYHCPLFSMNCSDCGWFVIYRGLHVLLRFNSVYATELFFVRYWLASWELTLLVWWRCFIKFMLLTK